MQTFKSKDRFTLLFFLTLFALYGVLIYQYIYNRSVWNDEAYMILTLINSDARSLLLPLDYYQVAPILFLQTEKLASTFLGHSEYALRLVPLLCALAAVPLFYLFCVKLTGDRRLSLAGMILLVFTPGLIYYSSEVKQYCSDLFVTILLYYITFNNSSFAARRRIFLLSAAGVIAVFLSNISVIILFTIGLYFLYDSLHIKRIRREHWIPLLAWMIAFACNFLLFIKDHPHTEYMRNYWQPSFMPVNIFSSAFWSFVYKVVPKLFLVLLPSPPGEYFYLLSAFLFLSGLFFMWREKRFLLLYLCLTPILVHLALSALRIYPFEPRMLLYQVPLYILSITFGLFSIINKLVAGRRAQLAAAGLCLTLISVKTFMDYPTEHDNIKDVIAYITETHQAGESMYVSSGAVPGIQYYIQRKVAGFDDLSIFYGKRRVYDPDDYLRSINNVHGRLWVVASKVFPIPNNRVDEATVSAAIKQRGKLISKKEFVGNTVYLFDMP